jgi:hypothetical protein
MAMTGVKVDRFEGCKIKQAKSIGYICGFQLPQIRWADVLPIKPILVTLVDKRGA